MNIAIFYFSMNAADDRHPVDLDWNGRDAWIRAEVVDAPNEEMALDKARPREDESVMNTHRIKEPRHGRQRRQDLSKRSKLAVRIAAKGEPW